MLSFKDIQSNLPVNTDSYKAGMWLQYPPGTEAVYSYIESRGGRYKETLFFGLQAYLKEYLCKRVTQEQVDFAADFWKAHGEPFNKEGWDYIVQELGGKLPLVIRAVPEGTVVPVQNVMCVVENTDPKCFWLTTWVETSLLRAVWYGVTVATQSYTIKKLILEHLEKTGDPSTIGFKLHDFGARGVSSFESAMLGDMAHLVNFMGTDTVSGIFGAQMYYNEPMAGFSIPAAEHSTITSWGRENEADAYANMLKQFAKPGALVAVVSDSYDVFNATRNLWGGVLKQQVIDSGATVIIRPDSGTPHIVVCELARILDEKFGSVKNEKGYNVLNNVRIIQGDGINYQSIKDILVSLESIGYSADNIAFGMGGALLQGVNRDTQKFAMKCSSIKINGKWQGVSKDPVTDPGKRSKEGRVTLYKDPNTGEYYSGVEDWPKSELVEVYRDGELVKEYSFTEVRANSVKK